MIQSSDETPAALLNRGIEMGEKGELDKAAELMTAAAKDQNYDFLIRAGAALEGIKRFGKAQKIYSRAMKLKPGNFLTYSRLGALFAELEDFPLAVKNLEKAVELNPGEGDLYYNLALVYQSLSENDKAIKALEAALEKGARAFTVYGTLARIYEQSNQIGKLEEVLEAGLKECPDDPFLNFNSAVLERRRDNPEKALQRLEACLNSATLKKPGEEFQELEDMELLASFELGRNYDKLGEYDKAFGHFAKANRLAAKIPSRNPPRKEQALANITGLRQLDYTNWQNLTADPLENSNLTPVFLVGFPRSGTTLLHQILDGHSNLEALEEQPLLAALTEYISTQKGGFPAGLKDLDKAGLNQLRDSYMKGLNNLQTKPGKIRMVDKLPMNIIKAPLIVKLFPEAKFILALRHPCDCTLSCFMQNFDLNHAMMNFLSLEDATHYYRETFSLWLKYRREMNLDVHMVRYEDVVENLEREARAVISFLGMEWQDQVLDYRQQAREKKRINTPSYHQVIKPIYQHARGRWQRYQKHLDPFLERLAPYIEEFGYGDQD